MSDAGSFDPLSEPATVRLADDELARRARRLAWLVLDVDGVLTDGRLYYGGAGTLIKAFDVKDGLAIKLLRNSGLKVGLLTARNDAAVDRRAADLRLDLVKAGRSAKGEAFAELCAEQEVAAEAVAYVGDDLTDLPALAAAGLSAAPADAAPEVRRRVDIVLARPGGSGAVRQLARLLLEARGEWEAAVARYLG